jgi:hypothetical protein
MELLTEMTTLCDEVRAREQSGKLSRRELRVKLLQFRRVNGDLGQVQFDIASHPRYADLDEADREELNGFINETIQGADMIASALGEKV